MHSNSQNAANLTQSTAPPSPRNENRVATHDGYIWPVARHLMRQPEPVIERMCEDAIAARPGAQDGCAQLQGLGWSVRQIHLHGHEARCRLRRRSSRRAAA